MNNKSLKSASIFIVAMLLACACTFCVFLFAANPTFLQQDDIIIIYVPGWQNIDTDQSAKVMTLQKIFPKGKIIVENWAAQGTFDECLVKADAFACELASKIEKMPPEQRKKVVLIGHSLGGRIAVRTMALLAKNDITICRGIFLAAAIPDEDRDIELAITASRMPNINIYNKEDYILRHVYGTMGEGVYNALGAYGYGKPYRKIMLQEFSVSADDLPITSLDDYFEKFENHCAFNYLEQIKKVLADQFFDPPMQPSKISHIFDSSWKEIKQHDNWHLEQNSISKELKIVSPMGKICAIGTESEICPIWDNAIKLETTNSNAAIRAITVIQDNPNPPLKVIDVGWETIDTCHGWKLQKKDVLFKGTLFRILDPKDFQRANGNGNKMKKAFMNIRTQLERK